MERKYLHCKKATIYWLELNNFFNFGHPKICSWKLPRILEWLNLCIHTWSWDLCYCCNASSKKASCTGGNHFNTIWWDLNIVRRSSECKHQPSLTCRVLYAVARHKCNRLPVDQNVAVRGAEFEWWNSWWEFEIPGTSHLVNYVHNWNTNGTLPSSHKDVPIYQKYYW